MTIAAAPFAIRPMTPADIDRVVEIERASFPTSWPPTAYKRELEQDSLARYIVAVQPIAAGVEHEPPARRGWLGRVMSRLAGWATEQPAAPPNERIAGFLGLWYMIDEAHIVTVASAPEVRRHGVGEMLVAEALDLARARGLSAVTLEVRVSNTGAQALYEKYGFRRLGIRKRYYTDNGEDAVIMTTPDLDDAAFRDRLDALARARAARGLP